MENTPDVYEKVMHIKNTWETHQMCAKKSAAHEKHMGSTSDVREKTHAHEKHMGSTSDVREKTAHMRNAWDTHQMCVKKGRAHEKCMGGTSDVREKASCR